MLIFSRSIIARDKSSGDRPFGTILKNIIPLIASLVLLGILYFTGVFTSANLTHPFWSTKATLIGAAIGIVITLLLLWLNLRKPAAFNVLSGVLALLLVLALITTWYYARVFIDSEDFVPLAARMWFLGYNAIIALFIPVFTALFKRILPAA